MSLLTPVTFLPVGCILCAVVGWACGSSWTATAIVGIAFMTIATGLGVNPALTAGMVISGAYVGDKLSPLSDTTNLAAAVSGTGLFDHVRAMISTTIPVFIIALVLYTFTNVFGETKPGKQAACPKEVLEIALANLKPARAAGKAPRPSE